MLFFMSLGNTTLTLSEIEDNYMQAKTEYIQLLKEKTTLEIKKLKMELNSN